MAAGARQILVVAPAWVGDLVMSQVLYAQLKAADKRCRIDLLVAPALAPVALRMAQVRAAIALEAPAGRLALGYRYQLGRRLAATGYDRALVLPNSFKSALVPFFAEVPQRTGFLGEYRYFILNDLRLLDKQRLPQMAQRFLALAAPPGAPLPAPQTPQHASALDDAYPPGTPLPKLQAPHYADALGGAGPAGAPLPKLQAPHDAGALGGARSAGSRLPKPQAPLQGPKPPHLQVDKDSQRRLAAHYGLRRGQRLVALCPGAEFGDAKRWPIRHFAAVAQAALARGKAVWVLGSAGETALAEELAAQAGKGCQSLAGKTSLGDAIDILGLCEAVVSNDSGLMHIAAAVGAKVIALFGSTSPEFTPPLSKRAVALTNPVECSPCFARRCPLGHKRCLEELQPARVIAALEGK